MNSIALIEKLSNASGAPGFEEEVTKHIREAISSTDVIKDPMNNLFINEKRDLSKLTLMLDAHSDEVAFMVQFIQDDGLIRFLPLGGWVLNTIPAHSVKIITQEGKEIIGITGSIPPHFLSEIEKNKTLENSDLFIDIGATSRKEAMETYGVQVGDSIVPDVVFRYNPDNQLMIGKAFDNRLGCAAVIQILESLKDQNFTINVVGAIATQEEVGLRGAIVTAQRIKPNLAIVFEGSPADDRFAKADAAQCVLGSGPQIRHRDNSMITNPKLIRMIKQTAKSISMEIQSTVRSGGGTNGGSIHLAESGIPTLVIGIPTRYIHTHYSISHLRDFEDSVRLVVEFIKQLKPEDIENL